MLAKSKSDYIARRAALSAPTAFLPRLLLCSGLPQTSFVTIVDRLGKLGDANDPTKVYRDLLTPSATTHWGFGQLGSRRDIARKIIGRVAAYADLYNSPASKIDEEFSTVFITWVRTEALPLEKPRKPKPKPKKGRLDARSTCTVANACEFSLALSSLTDVDDESVRNDDTIGSDPDDMQIEELEAFDTSVRTDDTATSVPMIGSIPEFEAFVKESCKAKRFDSIELFMQSTQEIHESKPVTRSAATVTSP